MESTDANLLRAYIDKRCHEMTKQLPRLNRLSAHRIDKKKAIASPGQSLSPRTHRGSFDIKFNGNLLGEVVAESVVAADLEKVEVREKLAQFAAELSCLLNLTDTRRILKLDALVEEIAFSQPTKFNWTGVYLLLSPETLTLASFRGEPSPHEVIPIDRGICGAAVREAKTLNIADVKSDDRYLSCSIKTKSEIVVPIFLNSSSREPQIIGEIDIDSHVKNAFTAEDEAQLVAYSYQIATIFM